MFDQYSTTAPKGIIDTIKQGASLIFNLTYDLQKDLKLHYDNLIQLARHAKRVEWQVFSSMGEHRQGMLEQLPI